MELSARPRRGGFLLGTALAILAGCGANQAVVVRPAAQASTTLDERADPEAFERTRRRAVAVAHGVNAEATLWDGALVAAGLERGRRAGDDAASLDGRRERWVKRYLGEQTVFTVVIDLGNRDDAQGDPLADPKAWDFRLDRGADVDLSPTFVELEGVDRFPTASGGHHLRLAFAVGFAGVPIQAGAAEPQKLRLRVLADRAQQGMKRRELGARLAKRGAAMSWWVLAG